MLSQTLDLIVGNHTFNAALVDNSSTAALIDLLKNGPLTIQMSDYMNMEKMGPVGKKLPRNDEQYSTGPGDLILYLGETFVIYYDHNSWNFTRIGKMDNVTKDDLLKVLGKGNVAVTLKLH